MSTLRFCRIIIEELKWKSNACKNERCERGNTNLTSAVFMQIKHPALILHTRPLVNSFLLLVALKNLLLGDNGS